MNSFIVNCGPDNWEACNKETIFGLRKGNKLPLLSKGDLILFRISGRDYGVKALWYFESAEEVLDQNTVPWTDAEYDWILRCKEIVTFRDRFSEVFRTSSKKSSKIPELFASGIQKSINTLKNPQLKGYISNILRECSSELNISFSHIEREKNAGEFFREILDQLDSFPLPEEFTDEESLIEGLAVKISVNRYERNQQARQLCIDHYGASCCVCDFDFRSVYGNIGKDYIHVHHIIPLSDIGNEYIVNPIEDLRPVCPNCHAMIHVDPIHPSSIDELKQRIAQNSSNY